MIIQCEGCAAKYFLANAKVPPKPTRVRCPHCRAVFTLEPTAQNVVAAASERVVPSPPAPAAPVAAVQDAAPQEAAVKEAAPQEAVAQEAAPQEPAEPVFEVETTAPTSSKPKPSKQGRDLARAKRLARVLVSDILCYNQEKRDQALADGTLMSVLGDEIKKSWELYKEKVGPELAKSTNYFKEALNEILADGQKVF